MGYLSKNIILKSAIALLLVLACAFSIVAIFPKYDNTIGSLSNSDIPSIAINEVCPSNVSAYPDYYGDYYDYIEIYNNTPEAVNLKGYGLSDDADFPFKWVFPNVTIEPRGSIVVFASGKDRIWGEAIHTNFKISKDGEKILITSPDGKRIDKVDVPACKNDVAYGRYPDGGMVLQYMNPTPVNDNTVDGKNQYMVDLSFSVESGFFSKEFKLSLSSENSGAKIYYTTDGSDPTTKSTLYKGPITIKNRDKDPAIYATKPNQSANVPNWKPVGEVDKATVVRAIAVMPDGATSDIITKTYFVDDDYDEKYGNVSFISLVTDPSNLFSKDKGIFVLGQTYSDYLTTTKNPTADGSTPANYNQRGSEWEREASLTYFEPDGSVGFSQQVGIRTQGAWSRSAPQKSLRIYARKEYGESTFEYDLFDGLVKRGDKETPLTTFKSFIIRNGGNDNERTKIRDIFTQTVVAVRDDTIVQATKPCVVFINGEYWGVYSIYEDYSQESLANHYDVPENEVTIVKNYQLEEGSQVIYNQYTDFITKIQNASSITPELYEEICETIDIDNFIDYYCTEIYFANTDWPMNNVRLWRTSKVDDDSPYHDGKWRWLLFDLDTTLDLWNMDSNPYMDSFYIATHDSWGGNKVTKHTALFYKLSLYEPFVEKFTNVFCDMLNTVFLYQNTSSIYESLVDTYLPLMNDTFKRFGPDWIVNNHEPKTWWAEQMHTAAYKWLSKRNAYIPQMLEKNMTIDSEYIEVTLRINNLNGGKVRLGTINELDFKANKTWTGNYYADFSSTLTATANEGYVFKGWQHENGTILTDETITLKNIEISNYTAVFEKQ